MVQNPKVLVILCYFDVNDRPTGCHDLCSKMCFPTGGSVVPRMSRSWSFPTPASSKSSLGVSCCCELLWSGSASPETVQNWSWNELNISKYIPGGWFGTWILLFHTLGLIIPIDFHIFQRGWNHQPDIYKFTNSSSSANMPIFDVFLFNSVMRLREAMVK